ncbi:MAG: hypothetical protein A3B25_01780 [Candidatus Ryanbacteria bacterium RIFCSPLOWO2_01_FULL_48_26]|uniref:PKD domain-containing protein n=1 Tax=Candidatus Ryanbacteria bacterium RIFCSPLOWO2_01_FULL_48_26 TaxID=1802126 RepID=A0A1G2GVY3_9BACT|nr:MAG: hypothetical protein A3B25_01780 [Candidatus Ryanbacteria bacterium RIFCSPLOWO2_01_FULL_48_26]
MKKFASVFSVVSLVSILAVPVSSFAVTSSGGAGGGGGTAVSANSDIVAQLQAQIAALLAQVQQLQAQLGAQQGQTPAVFCHNWTNNLRVGDRGNAVDALVTALVREGFIPNPSNERIYGEDFNEQVASAVVGFQEKYASEILTPNGLSHGTGYVGASTRAKLNRLYGCGQPTQPSITVLSPNGGESWTKGTAQTIKWQDGASFSCPPNAVCLRASTIYDIKLAQYYPPCVVGAPCAIPRYPYIYSYIIATAVGGSSYDWKVGNTKGDAVAPDGLYTVQICQSGTSTCDSSDSYFKITSDSTSNKPPVISGGAFPTTLSVGQTGTWTIYASDPENGALSYSVDWGDVLTALSPLSSTASPNSFIQNATFTHSYSSAGTYTVNFKVADNTGQVARTSATVQVGNTSQPSITNVFPSSGPEDTYVIISGFNFTSTGNEVRFDCYSGGGAGETNIPSLDGKTLKSSVPTVPIQAGTVISYPLSCKITVNNQNGTSNSMPFSITSDNTQPSITITSPWSGGEKWLAGSTQTVRWNSSNIPPTNDMQIFIIGKTQNYSQIISNGPNIGYMPITIPTALNGDYELMISTSINRQIYSGSVYFTITAPTVIPMTDAEIITALQSIVRSHQCSPITVSSCDNNLDLDNSGLVNVTDVSIIGAVLTLSDSQFDIAYKKIIAAVDARMGLANGAANYESGFDANRNGGIDQDDKSRISKAMIGTRVYPPTIQPLTNADILVWLEAVVRNNPTSSLTPVGSPSFDFDLSGDGRVNATDQITLRNLSSLSDADFQMARDKMVLAIQKRISSAVGNPLYDAYLDFDNSGVITIDDLTKARNAMNSTRPVTHTVTLNPSSDNFFQVTSGSLTLSQLTSAGFVTTLMPGTRLEEVLVFAGNPPSPLESASATYYQWNYQSGGIAFYKVGMGLTQYSNDTVSPYFMIRNNTTSAHTLTLPTNVKFFGSTVQNPTTRPWDTATSTTQSASLSEMASVLNSVQAAINQLKGQLGTQ